MKLYIISTPIGNLKDITLRGIEILQKVDFIICEDTRVTLKILRRYDIKKELFFLNAHSEKRDNQKLISKVSSSGSAALISDSGTPGISDPGAKFISESIRQNIQIIPVPGPSSLLAALMVCGFPIQSFFFEGFLPQKKGRQKKLEQFANDKRMIIFFESKYRIKKLIGELNQYMPTRYIAVCRELTKKFEEVWRGKVSEIQKDIDKKTFKGEFVILLSPIQ